MLNKLRELLFANEGTKKVVFKNFLWLGIGQVGGRLIRAAITIYSARALGAAGYGVFSYAIGLAGFFVFFKNIGVDSIMTRDIAKHPESRDKIFSTGFWIEIVLLVVTAFLLLFVAPMFSTVSDAIVLLPLVAIMFIADDMRDFVVAFFRGVEKMEWEAAIMTAANILVTIFGFVALALARTPFSLMVAYTTASVVVTIVALGILFIRYGVRVVRHFERAMVAPILRSAWPIAVSVLPSIFLFNVDLVMLGWWRSVTEVGVYSAAQKVIGILALLPTLIATSTFPVFSRFAHQKDVSRSRELMESTLRMMFAFCAPVVLGGSLLAAPLLLYLFGADYASGAGAFVILLFTILSTYPLSIFTNFIFAHDLQKKLVYYPFISAGINLGLNYILVPRLGMEGASFASLVSFSVYAWLVYRLAKRIEYFSLFRSPAKVIISALVMAVVAGAMAFANVHVVINIILSATVYVGLLYALKDESVRDILSLIRNR